MLKIATDLDLGHFDSHLSGHVDDIWRKRKYVNWTLYEIANSVKEIVVGGNRHEFYKWFFIDAEHNAIGSLTDNRVYFYAPERKDISIAKAIVTPLVQKRHIVERNLPYVKMLLIVMLWTSMTGNNYHVRYEDLVLSLQVPPKYKTADSNQLYRGLILHDDNYYALRDDSQFRLTLKPRKCTSWTTDDSVAREFVEESNDNGIVISAPTNSLDIVLNLCHEDFSVLNGFASEAEVIVRGNGVAQDTVTSKDVSDFIGSDEELSDEDW